MYANCWEFARRKRGEGVSVCVGRNYGRRMVVIEWELAKFTTTTNAEINGRRFEGLRALSFALFGNWQLVNEPIWRQKCRLLQPWLDPQGRRRFGRRKSVAREEKRLDNGRSERERTNKRTNKYPMRSVGEISLPLCSLALLFYLRLCEPTTFRFTASIQCH